MSETKIHPFDDTKIIHINEILKEAIKTNTSDVHLAVGKPPVFRISGKMTPMSNVILEPEDTKRLALLTMNDKIKKEFKEQYEADYSYTLEMDGRQRRFRVNTFTQRECVSVVFRLIPTDIMSVDELKLPPVLKKFTQLPRGLVLVTGPTGSGKSTTLAAMIDEINRTRAVHIITLEDPIEFVHQHKTALINQREIGQDSHSFHRALKSVLREDPDVILLGEMRDLETIHMAITLAETGHLVFATLHTSSAAQTIDRIIDVFPPDQQTQIRVQLASSLEAVVCQTLIPKVGGGRCCATEVLIMNSAARANIRNAKTNALNDIMQMSAKIGMHTLEQSLINFYRKDLVTEDIALKASSRPDALKMMMNKRQS